MYKFDLYSNIRTYAGMSFFSGLQKRKDRNYKGDSSCLKYMSEVIDTIVTAKEKNGPTIFGFFKFNSTNSVECDSNLLDRISSVSDGSFNVAILGMKNEK